jgi:hypothetical protein
MHNSKSTAAMPQIPATLCLDINAVSWQYACPATLQHHSNTAPTQHLTMQQLHFFTAARPQLISELFTVDPYMLNTAPPDSGLQYRSPHAIAVVLQQEVPL